MPALLSHLSLCCYYCSIPRRSGQDSICVRLWGMYGIGKEWLSVTTDDIQDKKKEEKKKKSSIFYCFKYVYLCLLFQSPLLLQYLPSYQYNAFSFPCSFIRWYSLNPQCTRKEWQTSSLHAVCSSVLLSPCLCIRQQLRQGLPALHSLPRESASSM